MQCNMKNMFNPNYLRTYGMATEEKAKAKDTFNDQIKQFTDMQAKSMEPLRAFATIAADASEQMLRKNYEVMGDFVEAAVKQARAPLDCENLNDVAAKQIEQTKALAETMNTRTAEYVAMAKEIGEQFQAATNNVASSFKAA